MTTPHKPEQLPGRLAKLIEAELGRALQLTDGAPDVSGLICDSLTGRSGEYMRRYHVHGPAAERSVRFHLITGSDPQRHLHDHPWDFTSVLLSGSYTEQTPAGLTIWTAPCVIYRQAEQLHRLTVDSPVWTFIVTGAARRRWGFATARGWVHWRHYPGAGDLAPCSRW